MKRGGPLARKTPLRRHKLTERGRAILAGTHQRIPIVIDMEPSNEPLRAPRPLVLAVMAPATAPAQPVPKEGRYISEAWRRAVASLPCMLCGKHGETQCCHRNETKAMGQKVSDAWTAALCAACHRDIDQGSQHTRAERRERLDRAILLTVRELAHRGLLIPNPQARNLP